MDTLQFRIHTHENKSNFFLFLLEFLWPCLIAYTPSPPTFLETSFHSQLFTLHMDIYIIPPYFEIGSITEPEAGSFDRVDHLPHSRDLSICMPYAQCLDLLGHIAIPIFYTGAGALISGPLPFTTISLSWRVIILVLSLLILYISSAFKNKV